MSKKEVFSQEQLIASNPSENIWVQANAGTGKTKVLVHRLLRILFRNGQYDKNIVSGVLCLTYTNAAAGEMRNRVLKELSKWAYRQDRPPTLPSRCCRHRRSSRARHSCWRLRRQLARRTMCTRVDR